MQPIRQIVENMPEFFQVPPEIQHQRVEVILWPLEPQTAQNPKKPLSATALAGAAGYTGAYVSDEEMDVARFAADLHDCD